MQGAQLPYPCIGLGVKLECLLADPFELREIVAARRAQKTLVEESLRRGQHRMAIGVVLDMLVRLVADAHRAGPAVAWQGIEAALDKLVFETDAIDRLKVAVRSRGMPEVEQ